MRPEHAPQGDPCGKCGLKAARHRKRKRDRTVYMREYREEKPKSEKRIIGIDGEGYTDEEGVHRYVYMAACDEEGLVSELSCPDGVEFHEFASWLLDLPRNAIIGAFSFGYDLTKICESLPDEIIYKLMHPETHPGKFGPTPIPHGPYRLNKVGSLFTVKRDKRTRRVWDFFKFFQCSFVKALDRWKIASKKELSEIEAMKQERPDFQGCDARVKKYCQDECRLLASLISRLLESHDDANLKLRSFHGPGSTASVMLSRIGAKEHSYDLDSEDGDPLFREAVLTAYFGGRFEVSKIGPVEGPIYVKDIASAYPYQMARLPCFLHGEWNHYREWGGEKMALVRFSIEKHPNACEAWGPLPHRLTDGNIVFPVESAGGWAYGEELTQALKLHPGIKTHDCFSYDQECDCPPPFEAPILDWFEERKRWGKEGKGLVIKLGLNSMYGKSAQRVGGKKFRCMVRAGLITSGTRAMLLEAITRAKDPWNVLELATDSVLSREPLDLPDGPYELLGNWEPKAWEGGVMLLRPGLRFPLDLSAGLSMTASRGLSARIVHQNRKAILDAWAEAPMTGTTVQELPHFHGAKSSVGLLTKEVGGVIQETYKRYEQYGSWVMPKPRNISYAPEPKRFRVLSDMRLVPWTLDTDVSARSVPYDRDGELSDLVKLQRQIRDMDEALPDVWDSVL